MYQIQKMIPKFGKQFSTFRLSHILKMKSTWMIQISRYIKEYKFGSLMYLTKLTEQKKKLIQQQSLSTMSIMIVN